MTILVSHAVAAGVGALLRANGVLDNVIELIKEGATGPQSVTNKSRSAMINSRAFIDDNLRSDPKILKTTLSVAHSFYCGMILQCLQLDKMVASGKTIQSTIGAVSTEDRKLYIDQESRVHNAIYDLPHPSLEDLKTVKSGRAVITEDKLLPFGKIIDLDFDIPVGITLSDGKVEPAKSTLIVPLLVRVSPYYINDYAALAIFGERTNAGVYKRFIQWRTGEIKFLKDFILNNDVFLRSKKAMIRDKSKGYEEYNRMVNEKNVRFAQHIQEIFCNKTTSSNIANSIFVISEDTVQMIRSESGINMKNISDVQRFFKMSYSMMLFILDPAYEIVTLYLNGWGDPIEYSYKDMDIFKSKGDLDFGEVLKKLSSVS